MPYINSCEYFYSIWPSVKEFLNSAFISAFLSALAGAGLGVLGAQKLTERSVRRKELLDALRQTNALIILVATITNQSLRIKKQHVTPLSSNYFNERDKADTINNTQSSGRVEFTLDILHIPPFEMPIDALKNLSYSTHLISGKALALIHMVEQSLTGLSYSIQTRTEQIELFKTQDLSSIIFIQNYFGLIRQDGCIDMLYHDSIVNIRDYTDDVIFFAVELSEELQAHAHNIHKKLLKLTKDVGKVNTVDYSIPRQLGLIPPKDKYNGWLSGFKNHD
ncbi:hypothetical protein OR604_03550 [Aeromonas caviae]|uniref:hypothetical protein n=2 Tax=Aeromonas caviae TaxID=648 RepID=UPI00224ED41D|nr:hypothetical protein [Aeromonas caviae]MCX4035300.1 hypothetical protein [Aeromonas caviae]